jgi:hypothetical protein
MFRFPPCFALAAFLSSCTNLTVMSHVPLSTLSRLSSLKVADIDPELLRVAVRLPAALEPRQQGVSVHLVISGSSDMPAQTESFTLEPVSQANELAAIAAWQRPDTRLWLYQLAPPDVLRLRHIMSEKSSRSGSAGVTISAGAEACHRAPLSPGPLPTTTLLRTSASGYFALVENFDIRNLVADQDIAAKIPPCQR